MASEFTEIEQGRAVPLGFSGNTRVAYGPGLFHSIELTAQTTVGTGVEVYDGVDDNGTGGSATAATTATLAYGQLLWKEGAPAIETPYGPAVTGPKDPIRFRYGLVVKCLGTGQVGFVKVSE